MAYQSGEFVIPNSVSARTKAATVFNNTLYLVDPWPGVSTQISFDLTKLKKQSSAPIGDEPIDGDALTDPANWVSQSLSCPASDRKPALVSFAGAMFCFINSAGTLTASTLSLSDDSSSSGTWSKPISLLEADGKTAPDGSRSVYSDVSATTVGENIIIFACALASSSSNPTPGTFVAVYDTRDIQTSGNKWPAKWHDYLPLPPMNPGTLGHVSVEWFSTVAPTGKDTDPPAYYVTVLAQSDAGPDVTESTQVSYYSMTLGETKGNQISVKLARTSSETVGTRWFYANLLRDPASRPRCWIRKPNTPALVSSQVSLGFETQGKATKGVGAAWDISLKGGMGHAEGDSSGTTTSYDLAIKGIITTALDNDGTSRMKWD